MANQWLDEGDDEQNWLKVQNARMQLQHLDEIKALKWVYFVRDRVSFGVNKILFCTEDILKNTHVKSRLDQMLRYADAVPNSIIGSTSICYHLVIQVERQGSTDFPIQSPWLDAVTDWDVIADWGYQGAPHKAYHDVRIAHPLIHEQYPKAKDLEAAGIQLSHIIFVE